jgi:uncharacterized protein (DUF488 family)
MTATAQDPTADQNGMLFTIGHGNAAIDEIVAALQQHGVEAVVDVRSTPYSQWTPWFNRPELERSLPAIDS